MKKASPIIGIILGAFLILFAVFLPEIPLLFSLNTPTGESTLPSSSDTQATIPSTEAPSTEPSEPSTEPSTEPSSEVTEPTAPPKPYTTPVDYPNIQTEENIFEAPKLPIPADDAPEEEWIAFFYGLIYPYQSWYNTALNHFYEKPEDITLDRLFYLGSNYGAELSADEVKFLTDIGCYNPDTGSHVFVKVTPAEMESVLQIYFGISLEQTDPSTLSNLHYYEPTNAYLDFNAYFGGVTDVLGIVSYSRLENGDYTIRYVSSWADIEGSPTSEADLVLRRVGDHFQIISNTLVGSQ